jgi:hypothetical protein
MKCENILAQITKWVQALFNTIRGNYKAVTENPDFEQIITYMLITYDTRLRPVVDLTSEISDHMTVIKVAKKIISTPDYLYRKKVEKFVEGAAETEPREKTLKFIQKFIDNPKNTQVVAEIIVFTLDKFERLGKAKLLGLFFAARCRLEIDEEEFKEFAHALSNINIDKIGILKKYYDDSDKNKTIKNKYQLDIDSLNEQKTTDISENEKQKMIEQQNILIKERDEQLVDLDSEKNKTFLSSFANVGLLSISSVSGDSMFAPPYSPNELGKKFIDIIEQNSP